METKKIEIDTKKLVVYVIIAILLVIVLQSLISLVSGVYALIVTQTKLNYRYDKDFYNVHVAASFIGIVFIAAVLVLISLSFFIKKKGINTASVFVQFVNIIVLIICLVLYRASMGLELSRVQFEIYIGFFTIFLQLIIACSIILIITIITSPYRKKKTKGPDEMPAVSESVNATDNEK